MVPSRETSAADFTTHSAAMRRLARQLLFDASQADDVVQQAWLAVCRSGRPEETSLKSWLSGVVRNLSRQSRREEARRKRREEAVARPEAAEGSMEALDRIEVLRRLIEAVDELDDPYRQTISMRFFEELSPKAIAKRRGVPVDTVHTQLRRGLERLRARLDPGETSNREAFLSALLPLAGPLPLSFQLSTSFGSASSPILSSIGPLAMGTKTALTAAGVVLVALAISLYRGMEHSTATIDTARVAAPPELTRPQSNDENAELAVPLTDNTGTRANAEALRAADGVWVIRGTTKHAENGIAIEAEVELEIRVGDAVQATTTLRSDEKGVFLWQTAAIAETCTVHAWARAKDFLAASQVRFVDSGEPPRAFEFSLLPLNLVVRGRVTDEASNRPIPGVCLRTNRDKGMEAITDEAGNYSFKANSERPPQFIYAQAEGFAALRASVGKAGFKSELRIDFELPSEVRIQGRVSDEFGAAIQGAKVKTFYSKGPAATTDAQGNYDLGFLDPGRPQHMVTARKEGFVHSTESVATAGKTLLELDLQLPRGARVEGLCLDENGNSLPGVDLYIGFSPSAYDRLDAKSDDHGHFAFETVGRGEQTLVAQLEGFSPARRVFEVPSDASSVPTMTLVFEAGHHLAGRVVEAGGKAVVGIHISVRHHGEYTELRTQTDENGAFQLDGLPDEALSLELYGTGFVRLSHSVTDLDRDDVELIVQRSGKIAGTVVDGRTGEPLNDFRIRFVDAVSSVQRKDIGGYSATWMREGTTFSDPDGQWDSGDENLIPGGTIGIEAHAPGFAPTVEPVAVASTNPDPSDLVMRLFPGTTLRGTVIDRVSGRGVEGASLKLFTARNPIRTHDSDDTHRRLKSRSDANGEFTLENVPQGEFSIFVEHDEWALIVDGPFEVSRETPSIPRRIELNLGTTLSGRLLNSEGSAMMGALVRVQARSGLGAGFMQEREMETDPNGEFSFLHLPQGSFVLQSILRAGELDYCELESEVLIESEERVEQNLHPVGSATVSGTLTGEDLPQYLPVALVRLDGLPEGVTLRRTPSHYRGGIATNGAFEIEGVVPGRYRVAVEHRSWTSRARYHGLLEVEVANARRNAVLLPVSHSDW